jgi:hypothetical protein
VDDRAAALACLQNDRVTRSAPPRTTRTNPTNGLAVASLVVSIVSITGCLGLASPVGVVLGHRARRQIRDTGEQGDGLARAAIIVGWLGVVLLLLAIAVVAVLVASESGSGPCNPDAAGC